MATVVDTDLEAHELDVVQLRRDVDRLAGGSQGTIIIARPDLDSYRIEFVDERGCATAFVDARRRDFRVVWRP
jgi:hypothetical protein